MGTGCVFNRTALYGYEPPIKNKQKKKGFFSLWSGGSHKKNSKSSKKSSEKKKSSKHVDNTVPIFNLEDIEEGVEGNLLYFAVLAKNVELNCSIILYLKISDLEVLVFSNCILAFQFKLRIMTFA